MKNTCVTALDDINRLDSEAGMQLVCRRTGSGVEGKKVSPLVQTQASLCVHSCVGNNGSRNDV